MQDAGAHELLDDVGDGGGRKPGGSGEFDLGEPAMAFDGADDSGPVVFTK